jgi:hypothetical protein
MRRFQEKLLAERGEVMLRHYPKKTLKNLTPTPKLTQKLNPVENSVWELPPYVIAKFSGELVKVMSEAAEQYISERCFRELKKDFDQEAFQLKNPL